MVVSAQFHPRGNSPLGGWVVPRTGLGATEESHPSRPARGPPLHRLSYPGSRLDGVVRQNKAMVPIDL
jgi:hypothetical protein